MTCIRSKPNISIGTKHHFLTVISEPFLVQGKHQKNSMVKVKCDCGIVKEVKPNNLGRVKSCGCYNRKAASERIIKRNDKKDGLIGERYGRLTIAGEKFFVKAGKFRLYAVPCVCDCGTECSPLLTRLRLGFTKSCGCYKTDSLSERSTTHGMSKTRLYRTWAGMLDRCRNFKSSHYHNYGGRGIRVCDEWHKFEPFRDWAVSSGYSEELSIERIDNDGCYCPENCRWATMGEQANNRTNNRHETYQDETKTLAEWSSDDRCLVSYDVLSDRVNKLGWPIDIALTLPTRRTYYLTDEEKHRRNLARWAVGDAIKYNRMKRPICCEHTGCENTDLEAHHHLGYDEVNWLNIQWLCKKHHVIADMIQHTDQTLSDNEMEAIYQIM